MKIYFVDDLPQLSLDWIIDKGKSMIREDFSRARLKVWLVSHSDRYLLTVSIDDDGHIVGNLPSELPVGVYGFKAIWVKNEDTSEHPTFNRGQVNQAEIYAVFAVTDSEPNMTEELTDSVTIKIRSAASTYGYDGLSAYELAVLKNKTTLTENEWVEDNATMQANEATRQSTWEAQSAEVEDAIHDAGLATSAATTAASNAEQARQNILTTWGNDSAGLKHDVQAATVSASTAASAAGGAASAATTAAQNASTAASSATSAAASASSAANNANQKATLANTAATAASAAAASALEAAEAWTDTYKPEIEEALEKVEGFEGDLAEEIERATTIEDELGTAINENTSEIQHVEGLLAIEIENRQGADLQLVKNIKINGVAVEKDGQNAILPTASADGTKAGVVAVGAGNGLHMSTGHIILSTVTSDTNGAMLATDKVKLDSLQSGTDYYTKTEVDSAIAAKQDTLVSGTNIKTINGSSILGSGNLDIAQFERVPTNVLPTPSAATMDKLYMLRAREVGNNQTREYITVLESDVYRWEEVGVAVIDNLTSTNSEAALSAAQGKVLNDFISPFIDKTTAGTYSISGGQLATESNGINLDTGQDETYRGGTRLQGYFEVDGSFSLNTAPLSGTSVSGWSTNFYFYDKDKTYLYYVILPNQGSPEHPLVIPNIDRRIKYVRFQRYAYQSYDVIINTMAIDRSRLVYDSLFSNVYGDIVRFNTYTQSYSGYTILNGVWRTGQRGSTYLYDAGTIDNMYIIPNPQYSSGLPANHVKYCWLTAVPEAGAASEIAGNLITTVPYDTTPMLLVKPEGALYFAIISEGQPSNPSIMIKNATVTKSLAEQIEELRNADKAKDWSNEDKVEIPIPTRARVNIVASSLATTKTANINGYIEFWDEGFNYFRKPIVLNAQGNSTLSYWKKNQAIDLDDGSEIKFGNWVSQDSFHLKKFYQDVFRGQAIVGYRLTEQVYQDRGAGLERPFDYSDKVVGEFADDFSTDAMCHSDGFPVILSLNGTVQGVYVFSLKKHRDNYKMKKNNPAQIILDGKISKTTFWKSTISWNEFEIRNPKSLINADGTEYDGENPKEITGDPEVDETTATVKTNIERFSQSLAAIAESTTKETFEQYYLVEPLIDYFLVSQVTDNVDGFSKNWIWCTWDGQRWAPTVWDMDSIFGAYYDGTYVIPDTPVKTVAQSIQSYTAWQTSKVIIGIYTGELCYYLWTLYETEIKARYEHLRKMGIFTTGNISGLLRDWLKQIGYDYLDMDINECCADNGIPQTPSYRASGTYVQQPKNGGFFNSPARVRTWLDAHISYLDEQFGYTDE